MFTRFTCIKTLIPTEYTACLITLFRFQAAFRSQGNIHHVQSQHVGQLQKEAAADWST